MFATVLTTAMLAATPAEIQAVKDRMLPIVELSDVSADHENFAVRVLDAAAGVDVRGVNTEKISRYIHSKQKTFIACYRFGRTEKASAEGRVEARITVDEFGRVTDVKFTESTLPHATVSCMEIFVRAWVFPLKLKTDVRITYPFVFAPE